MMEELAGTIIKAKIGERSEPLYGPVQGPKHKGNSAMPMPIFRVSFRTATEPYGS